MPAACTHTLPSSSLIVPLLPMHVHSLCALLNAPDVELIFAVLEGLGAALDAGEAGANGGANRCVQLFEEAGGCDRLEALQEHENPDIYAKAAHLLDTYFGDTDAEDPGIAPVANAESFSFGFGGGIPGSGVKLS